MTMIFQLIMKLLTDKASLTCAVLLVTCSSESAVLQAIPDFCSSPFLCLGDAHGCGSSMVGHRTKAERAGR